MCSELFYAIFAALVLFVIDNYSSSLAVVLCGLFIYFYIQIFSKGFNRDRFIVTLIVKAWGGVSNIFLLWKHIILFLKTLFTSRKHFKSPYQCSYHFCGETACLEKEIDVIVFNISQYYLHSWYDKVGDNEDFILHLNSVIKEALVGICSKLTKVNRKRISYAVLQIYLHFFIHFMDAKKKSEMKLDDFQMKHWASQDSTTEWCYLQSLVSSLINQFGPKNPQKSLHSECSPILHNFIVEILTEYIFHPLSNLLSNPSQLNLWLLKVLEMYIDVDNLDPNLLNSEMSVLIVPYEEYNSGPKILLELDDSSPNYSESKIHSFDYSLKIQNMSDNNVDKYEINSTPTKPRRSTDSLSPFMSSSVKSSSNINLVDNDFSSGRKSKSEVSSPASCDTSTIKRSKSADYIRQMPTLRALNVKDYNIMMQEDNNKMLVALKSDSSSGNFIEQAEEAIEVPTLFSDVRISDTVQQSEAGFLPYTLYCIQYSGVFHDTGKSYEKPHFIKQEVSIRRRFREFLALQSRLEDNPNLKNYLKGIKGPSKWLALPFSNMDKKNIAERRAFLENYLKELCNQCPIAQSPELQEFLAYGGDATVAFVKKAADINVPRIDKMFVRGVKGAIDMFKTALPNTVEGGCSPESSSITVKLSLDDSVPEHRFQEHVLEYSSREPEIRGHLKYFLKSAVNIPQFGKSGRESEDYPQRASMLRLYKLKAEKSCNCSGTWDIRDENFILEENAFGNAIADLIIESLKESQMSCFHLLSVIKLLVSPTIDRYFVSMLDGITEQHLATFLHILHNALWPYENDSKHDGSKEAKENYSNTYNKLKQYIKVLITTSNITLNASCVQKLILERIYLFLSSLQCQQLNRCLLFHIFDVVLETMCSKEN